MGFLEDILARKAVEVDDARTVKPLQELQNDCKSLPPVTSLKSALDDGDAPRIIAEIKRASPSKGSLRPDLDAADTARTYRDNGAAAISVLTDKPGFGGSLDDVRSVRIAFESNPIPVLRKDFLVDPYQIWEARTAGADAVLLIVAALETDKLKEMMDEVKRAGLEALVEVHNEDEMRIAIDSGAQVIGINNRDLRTFNVDPETTLRVAPLAPDTVTLVAESGIRSPEDIRRYMENGFRAFLIGEALVTSRDIGAKLKDFLSCK